MKDDNERLVTTVNIIAEPKQVMDQYHSVDLASIGKNSKLNTQQASAKKQEYEKMMYGMDANTMNAMLGGPSTGRNHNKANSQTPGMRNSMRNFDQFG